MTETPNRVQDVELVEKTRPYDGYFHIDVYRLRHRRFGGGWTEVMSREMFERGHATVVLPYDPARDAVVLIEQFRIGAYAAGLEPWLIEPVAGIVEAGETPEAVARREAIEEAGCELVLLAGLLGTLALPIVLGLIAEMIDPVIVDADQAERMGDVPVLAALPWIS